MAKINMIGSDGVAFTTSLKQSRVHLANGTAKLATVKAGPRKGAAKKAPAKKATKKAAKKTYNTRAMKAR